MIKITNNALSTQKEGERVGKSLTGGEALYLYGELGSGKTTFTKGVARGLGIRKRILSPTFIIVRRYPIKNKPFKFLYHIDLYRLKKTGEMRDLGITEIVNNEENITVIEWPERLEQFMPPKCQKIYFKYLDENKREIQWMK